MALEGTATNRTYPAGARLLSRLSAGDIEPLGDEARDLAQLSEHGLPLAHGWVIPFEADLQAVAVSLERALRESLPVPPRASVPPPSPTDRVIKLRAWVRASSRAPRPRVRFPAVADLRPGEDLHERLVALRSEVRASGGRAPGTLWLRALVCDLGPAGAASSVHSADGDPGTVSVWLPGERPWRMDRKTMRTIEEGHGELPVRIIERAADLADRAQLALGRPVEIDWVLSRGRPAIARVRPVQRAWRFTDESWRMVALLWHDEGPIAPLAVDGLDKALREEEDPVDEARVRRVFARAYRRIEPGRGRRGERRHSFAAAAARVARVVGDVAAPISQARGFSKSLDDRLSAFDTDDLRRFDESDLMRALRERQRVVIEAYELLDRGRQATSAVLGAIEAALGTVPRDCVQGLAAIRRTRARRRLDDRLQKALSELSEVPHALDALSEQEARALGALRRELNDKRSLGLDIRPLPYGASDEALVDGMRAVRDGRAERAEREQRGAIRRLMATARARPLGRGRAALARTLTVVIERLAVAKGRVAEGLADANLRLRDVAIEIGRRLVDRGVLDEPDDVLYLVVAEIQEALDGEPGAYTARVRLRREEDARWRRFDSPTRLPARRATAE